MFKQFLAAMLSVLLINTIGLQFASANSKEDKRTRFAEKVRMNIEKLGTGENARVQVKLRDSTRLKGYISGADGNSFTLTDFKTGVATNVVYSDVKSVKGNNLSTKAKIAIGVGIAAAVIFIIYFVTVVHYDD